MCVVIGQVKIQDDGAAVLVKLHAKLVSSFWWKKNSSMIGDFVSLIVDDNVTGYILEKENPAIITNAEFALDAQSVPV